MSVENISVDYSAVEQLSSQINASDGGGFQEIVSDYEKLTNNMSKSAGEMFEAIRSQIGAEKEIVEAMSKTCLQLVGSIEIAAQSFQNIDTAMTRQMD